MLHHQRGNTEISEKDTNKLIGGLMGMVLVLAMAGAIFSQKPSSSSGIEINPTIESIQIVEYSHPTNPLRYIYWGILSRGDRADKDAYVINHDNKSYTLTITTSDWNPPGAVEYMSFSENGTNHILTNQLMIRFSLEVFENCTGITSFSFMITLNFEEVT